MKRELNGMKDDVKQGAKKVGNAVKDTAEDLKNDFKWFVSSAGETTNELVDKVTHKMNLK
jgi:hypothetical protein